MIKRRRFPKIFFGWWTVIAGGVTAGWAGGYASYGFSALFKPIASELGFSRAITSTAASISRLEAGFEAPVAGWLADKFGPKWIVVFAVVVVSLSLILMNYINSLWAYFMVWGVMLGIGHNITAGPPINSAIANWFVKKRGIAMGIKWMLQGLSGVVVLPIIAWLILRQGWRTTCVIGGIVMALVGLPLTWFCFKHHRPEYYGLLPDGASVGEEAADTSRVIDRGVKYAAEVEEVEFTLRQAIRTPAYWLLIVAQTVRGLAMPTLLIHGVPFLTDVGIGPQTAANILALLALVSLPTRFIGGFLADRVRKSHLRFLVGGAYLLQSLGFTIFLLHQTMAMIYVWFVVYGLGHGVAIGTMGPLEGRYFGRKAFGSITGLSSALMTPIGIAAPIYVGWVYDTTGSYINVFTIIAGLLAFAAVFMSFILPPKPPAQITDVHQIL